MTEVVNPLTFLLFCGNLWCSFTQKSAQKIIKQMFIIHPLKKEKEKHLLCHYHPSAFAISPLSLLRIFSP